MNRFDVLAEPLPETEPNHHNRGSLPGKDSDEWRTPLRLVRAIERHFGIAFIADMAATRDNAICPVYFTKEDDALKQSPAAVLDRVERFAPVGPAGHSHALWCNPPYGSTGLDPWMEHAYNVSKVSGLPYVLLVPASRCEQAWFLSVPCGEFHVAFLRGRVPFLRPDGTPGKAPNHPSFVVAFPGDNTNIRAGRFSQLEWRE